MADKYVFELNDGGLKIIILDELGPLNTWSSEPVSNCLIVESGAVNLQSGGFICGSLHSGNQTILKLLGANWSSEIGDKGQVTNVLASGCYPTKWELVEKD